MRIRAGTAAPSSFIPGSRDGLFPADALPWGSQEVLVTDNRERRTEGLKMDLKEYFENTKGFGVLATSDKQGRVDAAVYARPHVMEDGTVASIMSDRLTHENLKTNPHAAYLFLEEGGGYRGKRLFLTKVREEQDAELIKKFSRRCYPSELEVDEPLFLVVFRIDKELPLIGAGD
jgi:hypothetical protein